MGIMLPKMGMGHFMAHNALSPTSGHSAILTSGNGTQFFYIYDLHYHALHGSMVWASLDVTCLPSSKIRHLDDLCINSGECATNVLVLPCYDHPSSFDAIYFGPSTMEEPTIARGIYQL
jgi:hypothetical protein